jgi:uncharacterized membrane protein (DUF2068 family)
LVCSWRGHAFGAERVHDTADGRVFAQCQRCGDWVLLDERPAPVPAAPRRGRALRQAIVVRAIAVDRAVHAVAFGSVAVAAVAVDHNIDSVRGWADGTLDALRSARHGAGGVSSHGFTAALLERLSHLTPHSLTVLAMLAAGYAVVSAIEAVGLWMERRWAEYLTAIVTASFLPFEVHELFARVTLVRLGALAVNIAILVYLVWAKHLFGVRGRRHDDQDVPDLEPLPEITSTPLRSSGN